MSVHHSEIIQGIVDSMSVVLRLRIPPTGKICWYLRSEKPRRPTGEVHRTGKRMLSSAVWQGTSRVQRKKGWGTAKRSRQRDIWGPELGRIAPAKRAPRHVLIPRQKQFATLSFHALYYPLWATPSRPLTHLLQMTQCIHLSHSFVRTQMTQVWVFRFHTILS